MKYNYPLLRYFSALAIFVSLSTTLFAQKMPNGGSEIKTAKNIISAPNASVEPVVFDHANISCADLNASTDIRFSHIISNDELKLDFGDPNGTFPFSNGGGRIVVGTEYPNRTVTIASGSGTVSSWSSQIPITAINVKVGNTSYVYPYKPFKLSDTNLATGDHRGISHVSFCFGEPTGVTAGEGSITGRVVDFNGNGIAKAQLVLINGTTGEARITMTSPFGYYVIGNLDVNEFYVLNVSHKRFEFDQKQMAVSVTDSLTEVNFVGKRVQ